MSKRRISLVVGLLLLSLILAGWLPVASASRCNTPTFVQLATGAINSNPTPPLAKIIGQTGGLPTTGSEFNANDLTFSSFSAIGAVDTWRITSFVVEDPTPVITRILDDDPNYAITMDVETHYSDGSTRLLRWTTWRYGLVLCPMVIPYGDGPSWKIALLD